MPPAHTLHYGARVSDAAGPEILLEQPIPDLALPSSLGGTFRLRQFVGVRPLVLFFYIHNGTPG